MDVVAPTSLNGHLYMCAYWLHGLMVRGGYPDAGQASVLLTPSGRARLYSAFLGPEPGTPMDRLAAFQRDRDPVVAELLGTNKRRGRYLHNSKYAEHLFFIATALLAAEHAAAKGSESDAWSLVAHAQELKGNIDALLGVARDIYGEKLPHAAQRKGAAKMNELIHEAGAEAMKWARDQFQCRLAQAEADGTTRPTKVGFARTILEINRESKLSPLQEEHGVEVTEKTITDVWLKGL